MVLTGNGVSPGITVGKIHIHGKLHFEPVKSFCAAGEEQTQVDRYGIVKQQAIDELEKIVLSMEKTDPEKARIFKVHQDIVNDVAINEEIPDKIINEHWNGDWAIYKVYDTFLRLIRRAPDPLIAERGKDFEDVRGRLLKLWYGKVEEGLDKLTEPVIVAVGDLLPSDAAAMDKSKVLAVLTETGGSTSHSAIIARSYGIPAILGIKGLLETVKQEQMAAVNASDGTVNLDPDNAMVKEYTEKSDSFRRNRELSETFRNREAWTADKVRIDIGLNIASADDAELQAADYVDSVGVFRTEFLYMGRNTLPGEDEQFNCYRKVLERFGKRTVILRTIDIGGDKTLSSMELPGKKTLFWETGHCGSALAIRTFLPLKSGHVYGRQSTVIFGSCCPW